jgi:hypothetical protein
LFSFKIDLFLVAGAHVGQKAKNICYPEIKRKDAVAALGIYVRYCGYP